MLTEESAANDALGHDVTFKVAQKVRPADSTKYRSYVDDVGYITKLLLSLSGRLARTENSLHIIGDKASPDKVRSLKGSHRALVDHDRNVFTELFLTLSLTLENQKILETKRDRLLEQLAEAKSLKDDIDRRGLHIANILLKNLSADEYADFDYFINMKAKLIVDSREVADKIKLGEEQLTSLKDTLVHSEC